MSLPRTASVAAAAALAASGCYPYKDYLYSLPVTERDHNDEAITVVMRAYGIVSPRPEVRWIVQDEPLHDENSQPVLGVTHDCVSWVWWPPLYGTDPEHQTTKSYSHTVMAHEIAHCALWLYGYKEGDPDHSDVAWWGTKDEGQLGGLVRTAMNALEADGL